MVVGVRVSSLSIATIFGWWPAENVGVRPKVKTRQEFAHGEIEEKYCTSLLPRQVL